MSLEALLEDGQRSAVLRVIYGHPEISLGELASFVMSDDPLAPVLRTLTIDELLQVSRTAQGGDSDPSAIDYARLGRAKKATGEDFDELAIEVLTAAGRPVAAAYLRTRLGGPRWKLQASMRRLEAAGVVRRHGQTSGTRWGLVERS
ncbi:hypothetical protein G6O69_38035 [Pseudenhygromyxa sp. WMMC2535]|uniref:hypothetical protein n=1 Tax=Pseudenhygromyxa sp. WMMC2535 TaxID=2712867 RepID=UPI0015517EF4|nr:hypothetical protein [Pseudenhygromyxa sp. WMMC2535]NVB38223.1 hypothetical protein [Pseudenhygromyxa sp. WMMC2535]NVB41622.1 hypothetical protein [Pseudenhygromyxa sp. WMMC2535]NVB43646.1 hypothetical protein [Pseudenhygromyxa sp. WMMC2535]NVB43671.1 hypothetical protein [Pseudenhygromyxa sp. WMMC2535]